jgi:hypothetical protein
MDNETNLTLDDIKERLANNDVELLDDRDLFDLFMNGCTGWNNFIPEECIENYVAAFIDDSGGGVKFTVTDGEDLYTVEGSSSQDLIIKKQSKIN